MNNILAILEDIRPDLDFEGETALVDGGILDSFDIFSIFERLNEKFNIEISVDDIVPENFNSVESIKALVDKYI